MYLYVNGPSSKGISKHIAWTSSYFVDSTWCTTKQTYTWARPFLWVASGITVASPDINVYRNLPTIRCYCPILNSLHCTYEQSYTSQVFACTGDYWAHFIGWRACLTLLLQWSGSVSCTMEDVVRRKRAPVICHWVEYLCNRHLYMKSRSNLWSEIIIWV